MSIACDAEDIAAEDIPLVTLAAALGVLDSLGLLLSSKKRSNFPSFFSVDEMNSAVCS